MKKYKRLVVLLFLCVFTFFMGKQAYASVNSNRYDGKNRYETSIKVSKAKFNSSKNVIIASGEIFADSLCAAPLAKQLQAPILLTSGDTNSSYFREVKEELLRLGTKNVYIIGGEGVILPSVEKEIKTMGIQTERISGKNRYETSLKVAQKIQNGSKAFVVLGGDFPDAVSVGSIAARDSAPIILSDKNSLPTESLSYLKTKGFSNVYVISGPNVISDSVVSKIPKAQRIFGQDRYETNYKVAQTFMNTSLNNVYIANGQAFPDATVASSAAAKEGTFVILCNTEVNGNMAAFLREKLVEGATVNILGGTSVVPSNIVDKIFAIKKIICIDPGHGMGNDVGTTGVNGLREKDVTLSVGLKLGKILESKGIKVVYTRTKDMCSTPMTVTQSLQKRCDIAKQGRADYFISIHCNSAESSSAHGIETWYSPLNNKTGESAKLASAIQKSLVNEMKLTDRGVKNNANWYVNKYAPCPSILAELAFINNTNEAKILASDAQRGKIATAIAHGVFNFLGIKY